VHFYYTELQYNISYPLSMYRLLTFALFLVYDPTTLWRKNKKKTIFCLLIICRILGSFHEKFTGKYENNNNSLLGSFAESVNVLFLFSPRQF
jgi:hypothetical protein